jgi:exodeoxyribonuclease VII large subunit
MTISASLDNATEGQPEIRPLSVSQLNREARYLLEGQFPSVLVEGEISNFAAPSSGHWYFTLKDAAAQVRCAMFRNRNLMVRFRPREGSQVLVKGRVSLYEGRGDYQLLIEQMEEMGDGLLRRRFDQLKAKLFQEGLFDASHKRQLPFMPRHVGVITSATGAAIRDILSVLGRRFPAIQVTILPVQVQGQTAAQDMVKAIALANRKQGCLVDMDVLIIGRGGGSLEDLWSFNDEELARAIHASELPVISAVGHEVDFTIADFCADVRAATPSAAAELVSPDQHKIRDSLSRTKARLLSMVQSQLTRNARQLAHMTRQLKHPGRRLQEQAQRLDDLERRLMRGLTVKINQQQNLIKHYQTLMMVHSPASRLQLLRQQHADFSRRLTTNCKQILERKSRALAASSMALQTVSPLATLARGYSISLDMNGKVIRQASQLKTGDFLQTMLGNGQVNSVVVPDEACAGIKTDWLPTRE